MRSRCVERRKKKEGTEYKILLKLYFVHFKIYSGQLKRNIDSIVLTTLGKFVKF